KAVDPTLAALFSTSVGPVEAAPTSRYTDQLITKPEGKTTSSSKKSSSDKKEKKDKKSSKKAVVQAEEEVDDEELEELEEDDEELSEASDMDDEADAAELLEKLVAQGTTGDKEDGRKRKRKNRDNEDLEANYLDRLAGDDEPTGKRVKAETAPVAEAAGEDSDGEVSDDEDDAMSDVPAHESATKAADSALAEIEKANRTIFVSNVSSEAITSRRAKKTLLNHLSSILDKKATPPQIIQSIRFRSTAFSSGAVPKRASYITKSVMEATTKSTNAYVVYSSPATARLAVTELNGTTVLDRHIRVDSVAHPAPVDHRRCVFVGNLGFVDDETVVNVKIDEDGKEVTEKRKRTKVPMDVEEGLWCVFSKEAGRVESVRVVRDPVTRIGKGIAYVQFYDANAVEKAILLQEKKFPPMLPRALRVSRCKAPHRTARAIEAKQEKLAGVGAPANTKGGKFDKKKNANVNGYTPKITAEAQTLAGRAAKLLGRSGAAAAAGSTGPGRYKGMPGKEKWAKSRAEGGDGSERRPARGGPGGVMKTVEDIIFEGRRASAKDGRPKDLKFKGSKPKGVVNKKGASSKPGGRAAARVSKWKKSQEK
ncbi:hypothetical protein B0T17DRAFT_496299, partial [Bombardia bombarda]